MCAKKSKDITRTQTLNAKRLQFWTGLEFVLVLYLPWVFKHVSVWLEAGAHRHGDTLSVFRETTQWHYPTQTSTQMSNVHFSLLSSCFQYISYRLPGCNCTVQQPVSTLLFRTQQAPITIIEFGVCSSSVGQSDRPFFIWLVVYLSL